MEKLYYISVRSNHESAEFNVILRGSAGTDVLLPKLFTEDEMLKEYPKLVVKYGGYNVIVGEAVFLKLEGKARFVDKTCQCPWEVQGKIDII